jgi:hypothetical protein
MKLEKFKSFELQSMKNISGGMTRTYYVADGNRRIEMQQDYRFDGTQWVPYSLPHATGKVLIYDGYQSTTFTK